MGKYTKNDKTCPHCIEGITGHNAAGVIYRCEVCSSNNLDSPPMIDMTFPKEEVTQNQSAEAERKFTQYRIIRRG